MGKPDGRTSRLNMRLTPDALAKIREGARESGKSVSSFVIEAALAEAAGQAKQTREKG